MRFSHLAAFAPLAVLIATSTAAANGQNAVDQRDIEHYVKGQALHAAGYGAHRAVDAAVEGKDQVKHAGKGSRSKGQSADDYAHDQAESAEDYVRHEVYGDDDDADQDDSDDADEGESGRKQGAAAEAYAHDQAEAANKHAAHAAHNNRNRDPSPRKKQKHRKTLYPYEYDPELISSASHWLETKTAAYAYPRALSTASSPSASSSADTDLHERAGFDPSAQGSGGSGGFSIYQFASSFAGLPSGQGGNARYASATARAKPTFAAPGQQQQPAVAPAASSSIATTPASQSSVAKRQDGYNDIGESAASGGTSKATDAVSSIATELYGKYGYAYGKRNSATPSPTTPVKEAPVEEKTETNAASKTRGGAPLQGIEICLLACAGAAFAGALL